MITAYVAVDHHVASRPALQAQVDDGRHELVLAERVEAFVGGFRGDDREALCISRNFTRGRRTERSSSTTRTRRVASLLMSDSVYRLRTRRMCTV